MGFPYKAVLFDLDGTLIDSAVGIAEALDRFLRQHGLRTFDEATVRGWIGEGAKKLVADAFRAAGSNADVEPLMPGYFAHYADTVPLQSQPFAGVGEALAGLHAQGVKLAVCTNKAHRFIAPTLKICGWTAYIDACAGGDLLPHRKPEPQPLLHLADRLGVEIADCLFVGDSMTDANAAKNAGMDLVLVDYGYAHGADLHAAGARAVVGDLRKLLDLA